MPTGTGIDAQIGYVVESAYGTAATVTRFLPLVSETLSKQIERVESPGSIAGAHVLRSNQWSQGNATVGGDVQHELYDSSIGMLLRAAFGTVTTTGSGTYTHVFWPTNPGVSLTAQVGRPTIYGSVVPFTYSGCKVASFEIAGAAGANWTAGFTFVAQEETMGTALAAAAYTSGIRPWRFQDATLSIAGVTTPIKSFKLSGDNSLADDRRFLGSTVIQEPLRQELGAFTGEIMPEWGNPSAQGTLNYHRFFGGTEAALIVTATAGGTASATITANVRYDGVTPNVSGRGIIDQTIPFKCIASGTLDSNALSVQIINGDSTA